MATGGSEVMSDEILNIKCCICVKKGLSREAEKYCIECQDYYCSSCTDMHMLFPGMSGHKILDKASFRSQGQDSALPSIPTQRCSLHPFKVTDMFCQDHDEVICTSCVAMSHRSCTHIHSIPDDVEHLYNKTEPTKTKQKINQLKITMEEIKKSKEAKIQEVRKTFKKEVESVKAFREEIQEILDKLEQRTIKELTTALNKIEKSIEADLKEVEDIIKAVNDIVPELKKCEGNKAQEFVCLKSFLKLTIEGETLEKRQKTKLDQPASFTANQQILSDLNEFSMLGSVSTDKTNEPKTTLYSVKSQTEMNVKLPNDRNECLLIGSCFTTNGFLLLADSSNKSLKCLDLDKLKEINSIDLKASPNSVCQTSETEAAVSFGNNSIQFVLFGKKMTATSFLTMNHACYGLAHKDGIFFISDGSQTVYIHDRNGKELCKVTKDGSGQDIFRKSRHFAVSGDGQKVFIADNTKGLVELDIHGKYLSTIAYSTVSYVQGVCTDGRNVFVAGHTSQNIVQFGEDSKLLGEIAKFMNTRPLSVCFDHIRSRLIVTNYGNNNSVVVLELE